MNRSILGSAKAFLLDTRMSLIIFWAIMFSIYVLLLIVALQFDGGVISSGGSSPLYVYMLLLGILGVKESLPYALGMNVRRRDYFFGLMLSGLGIAAASSAFVTILSIVEEHLVNAALPLTLHYFHMPFYDHVSIWGEWVSQFIFLTFAFTLGFLLFLLPKRYGSYSLYILGGIIVAAALLIHLFNGWPDIFKWLVSLESVVTFSLWLLPLALFNTGASYVLLRKATV